MIPAFLIAHPFEYTILTDSPPVNERYRITTYPTNLIIDQKGIIHYEENFDPASGKRIIQKINELKGLIGQVSLFPGK